jgi:hypothetical protein
MFVVVSECPGQMKSGASLLLYWLNILNKNIYISIKITKT